MKVFADALTLRTESALMRARLTSRRMLADLAVGLLQSVGAEMADRPVSEEDEAIANEPLLAPMLKDNDVSCRGRHSILSECCQSPVLVASPYGMLLEGGVVFAPQPILRLATALPLPHISAGIPIVIFLFPARCSRTLSIASCARSSRTS